MKITSKKKVGEFNEMRTLSDRARANGSDWMRGQDEPQNWDVVSRLTKTLGMKHGSTTSVTLRFKMTWMWLSEAVYQFYQVRLGRMTRKNTGLGRFLSNKVCLE